MDKPENQRAIDEEQRWEDWLNEPTSAEGLTNEQIWERIEQQEEDLMPAPDWTYGEVANPKLAEIMKNPKPMPEQSKTEAPQQKQQDRGIEK